MKKNQLLEMMSLAFEEGYSSAYEMRDQCVNSILSRYQTSQTTEPKVYSYSELQKISPGTKFHHSRLGKGIIVAGTDSQGNYMKFDNDQVCHLNSDAFPWNEKMQLISSDL